MSDVNVKITIFGDELFRRKITAMRLRSHDFSPILRKIGDDWTDIIEEQYATEGARTGNKWARLELSTVLKRGSAHPILVHTGEMLVETSDPSNIDVSHDSLTLQFPENIQTRAEFHQFGFTNPQGKEVPARPIFDFTDFDRANFERKIEDWLVHGDEHF